jgi:hypothetical protein
MDVKIKEALRDIADSQGAVIRGFSFATLAASALKEIERLEFELDECKRGAKLTKSALRSR